jgi:hypothetical protein
MDYPWWTISPTDWGFREEDEIYCLACAEASGQAVGRELTDLEINRLGDVHCQACGRTWAATHIADLHCACSICRQEIAIATDPTVAP